MSVHGIKLTPGADNGGQLALPMSQPSSGDAVRLICLGSGKISIKRYHHACDDSSFSFFSRYKYLVSRKALYIGGREHEIISLREIPHLYHGFVEELHFSDFYKLQGWEARVKQ